MFQLHVWGVFLSLLVWACQRHYWIIPSCVLYGSHLTVANCIFNVWTAICKTLGYTIAWCGIIGTVNVTDTRPKENIVSEHNWKEFCVNFHSVVAAVIVIRATVCHSSPVAVKYHANFININDNAWNPLIMKHLHNCFLLFPFAFYRSFR